MGWEAHPDSSPQKIERKNPTKSGWWFQPLWKYESQLELLFPTSGKIIQMFQTANQKSMVIRLFCLFGRYYLCSIPYDKRDTTKSSKGSLVDWHSAQLMRTMTCHTWPTCPLSQEFQNACPVPISKRSWGPWTVLNENHLSLWYCTQTRFAGFVPYTSILFHSFPS